jgi:hypothetical protein
MLLMASVSLGVDPTGYVAEFVVASTLMTSSGQMGTVPSAGASEAAAESDGAGASVPLEALADALAAGVADDAPRLRRA